MELFDHRRIRLSGLIPVNVLSTFKMDVSESYNVNEDF